MVQELFAVPQASGRRLGYGESEYGFRNPVWSGREPSAQETPRGQDNPISFQRFPPCFRTDGDFVAATTISPSRQNLPVLQKLYSLSGKDRIDRFPQSRTRNGGRQRGNFKDAHSQSVFQIG